MVFTRRQIENLSREDLIEELVKLFDITDQLKDLTDKFDNFSKKYEELKSDLFVAKKCSSLLYSRIVQLEKNAVSTPCPNIFTTMFWKKQYVRLCR